MSAETSTRPFQVGDRVRITDHLRHNQHPDAQYVYEGIVEKIDPAADPDSGLVYGPYLWAETEEYVSPLSGETFDRVFCEMTDDLTTGADGDDTDGRTIELLEPAPSSSDAITLQLNDATITRHTTDPDLSDLYDAGWVKVSTDAAQDHGPLAATLSDRTLAKVLSRPAHVPSLVLLDRDAAAQQLAAEVESLLTKFSDNLEMFLPVRRALADYRETTS